jgi:hypothetical protein
MTPSTRSVGSQTVPANTLHLATPSERRETTCTIDKVPRSPRHLLLTTSKPFYVA